MHPSRIQSIIELIEVMSAQQNKDHSIFHPIYSPRTSYKLIREQDDRMIADMTRNFDKLTIGMLKDEFESKSNKLCLTEFITVAQKHLKFWQTQLPNRQSRLVRYLMRLFNDIDINGNGKMEWQQFTNYIIEKATVLKNIKSNREEIRRYVKSEVTPKLHIDGIVHKLEYLGESNKIAFFEEGSNTIQFINAETGELSPQNLNVMPKQLVVNISSVKKEKNGKVSIRKKDLILPTNLRVLDMLYLSDKKYKILLVSTSDGYVRGWKHTPNGIQLAFQPDNEQQPFEHHFNSEVYCLAWDHLNQTLYCGQKHGSIYKWSLKIDIEHSLINLNTGNDDEMEEKVNLLITSMIAIPQLSFMASGRMDGLLMMWDTINCKKKWECKEHTRGILSLAFNESVVLLFSAGFDHKICIWNPYISSLIYKIEGHLSPILTLRAIQGTSQLISMDSSGIVKITDIRHFNIIASFSVDTQDKDNSNNMTQESNASCFIAINKSVQKGMLLVFAGKVVSFYKQDKNYNPLTADENTVVSCRYVKKMLCFFTPVGSKVKVWSALNGEVQTIYIDITANEITAFDFDFLKKRMIIGDCKGNIALYNTANGAREKNLTHHSAQINYLMSAQNFQKVDIFISCSVDNQIRVSRETEEACEVIRTISLKKNMEITCLRFCPQNRLIAVATNIGSLAFFALETGKNVGTYSQMAEDFTSVSVASKEMIIATSTQGDITIVGVPPFLYHFEKLTAFKHKDCQKKDSPMSVLLSCYSRVHNLLFVIDEKMYMTCYDLSEIFQKLKKRQLQEKTQAQRRKIIQQIIEDSTIAIRWQIKTHTQTVKDLQYIEEEDIIATVSYDKRVKLWQSMTGLYIDSLQQSYNKPIPQPLAYYDPNKNYLYTKDHAHAFGNVILAPHRLDFDPYLIQSLRKNRQEYFPLEQSNKEWNLSIKFDDIVHSQKKDFENIMKQLDNHAQHSSRENYEVRLRAKKNQILERRINLIKQIRTERSQPKDEEKVMRKYSKNYFQRNMMKCLRNLAEKNEGIDIMQKCQNDREKIFGLKKNFDYVPIYKMISQTEKTSQQIEQHHQYLIDLASKKTENMTNGSKSKLLREESLTANANRLYQMLKTTEDRTHRLASNLSTSQKSRKVLKYQRTASETNLHTTSAFMASRKDRTLPKID